MGEALKAECNEEITTLIKTLIQKDDFVDYEIVTRAGSTSRDGYISDLKVIHVYGTDRDGNNKILNLVAKIAPTNDELRRRTAVRYAYENEVLVYTTFFPLCRQIEAENRITNQFSSIAKCYTTSLKDKKEMIILENLKERGYRLWKHKEPVNDSHMKLVFKEYGKFHALSFAIREQKPEICDMIVKKLKDPYKKFWKKCDISVIMDFYHDKFKTEFEMESEKYVKIAFRNFIKTAGSLFQNISKVTDEYSVLIHGNSWLNNIMFKYGESTAPTDLCLLDFQLLRMSNPVIDLVTFFYSVSSKSTIDKYEQFLVLYHDSFSSYLTQLGNDPKLVYSFEACKASWKKYAKYGLAVAILSIHFILTDQNEAQTFAHCFETAKNITDAFMYDISDIDEYKKRIKDVVLHFIENNFI